MNVAAPYAGGNPNAQYLAQFPWIMNQGGGAKTGLQTVGTTAPMNYNAAYGGTPTIPDPASTAGAAVTGNLGNLADIYKLAGDVNTFTTNQAKNPYVANLPNYEEMTKQASQNITSNLEGQVPADVLAQLTQGAAERGIATGTSGGPNANAAYLRALGLTSLDLQNLGQTQLTGAMARTPVGPQVNPQSFFVSPEQQQGAAAGQALYSAAPIPGNVASANMSAVNQGINQGRGPVIPGSMTPSGASAAAAAPGAYATQPAYAVQPTTYTGPQYGTPGTAESSFTLPDLSEEQSNYYNSQYYQDLMNAMGGGNDLNDVYDANAWTGE